MCTVLLTGFSSGLPLGLSGGTLQAWMASEHVDLTVIGIFSLVGLPYTLKFFWSPVMDRYVPPFLGRRRGWMLVTQILLVVGITAMAFSDPASHPGVMATLAFLVAFFSASQDITIDAYRTEILQPSEYGVGAGIFIMGYRLAMIVSGAVALIMADHLPWKVVYLVMAMCMSVGIVTALWAREPSVKARPPKNLQEAVVLPFIDFFKRRGAMEMLLFVLIYKMDVIVATALTTPFMMELGFSKTDIGAVIKGAGLVATIVGTLIGGAVMAKIKIYPSLWLFGLMQGLSGATFILLAQAGHNYPLMVAAVTMENLCSGMGTAVFSAFMMSLCNKSFTATQYALITSFMAVTRVVASAPTGWLAKNVGWENYFLISILVAIPGLLLLTRYHKWEKPGA